MDPFPYVGVARTKTGIQGLVVRRKALVVDPEVWHNGESGAIR